MIGVAGFWDTLCDNAVCLLIVLPLVGAVLVQAAAAIGQDVVRQAVLTNIALTMGLMVVMVANYDPVRSSDGMDGAKQQRRPHFQMLTDLRWLGQLALRPPQRTPENGSPQSAAVPTITGLDIRFAVGVDGISLWLIVLTVLVVFTTVLMNVGRDVAASQYSLLLAAESTFIGTFAALDVVLFILFAELSLVPLFFLIGWWGGYRRRLAIRHFVIAQSLAMLLVALGLIVVVFGLSWIRGATGEPHATMTFSVPEIVGQLPALVANDDGPRQYWQQVAPWTFVSLTLGFFLQAGLVPFHSPFVSVHTQASPAGRVLLSAVLLKVGAYGMLRFLLPLFPRLCMETNEVLSGLVLVTIVLTAFLAVAQRDVWRLLAFASLCHVALALLGFLTLDAVGISGGLMHLVNQGLAVTLLGLLLAKGDAPSTGSSVSSAVWSKQEGETSSLATEHEALPSSTDPDGSGNRLSIWLFRLGLLSFIGVPLLNGFVSETLIVFAAFQLDPGNAAWALFSLVLLAWAFLRLLPARQRDSDGPRPKLLTAERPSVPGPLRRVTGWQMVGLVPVASAIVVLGLMPQLVLDRIEPSVAAMLKSVP